MTGRSWHDNRMKQCDTTEAINARNGLEAGFDYVVCEKLLKYVQVAFERADFARELPRIVACVRSLISAEMIETHNARIERQDAGASVERMAQFEFVGERLTAQVLVTS